MTRPRDWCGGKSFREAEPADWHPRAGDDPVELAQAWSHFRLARRVLNRVDRDDTTLQRMAEALGVTYEDQRRKVSGDQPLKARDIALWTLTTQADEELLGDFDGLLPPGTAHLAGSWQPGDWLPILGNESVEAHQVDVLAVLSALANRIAEAATAGIADCVDAGTLRYFVVEACNQAGVRSELINISGVDVAVGTPEQIAIRPICLPAVQGYGREERLDAQRVTAAAILDLAEHPAIRSYLLVLAHRRALGAVEILLPSEALRTQATTAVGPFDELDVRWLHQTVDITPVPGHEFGEMSLNLVEIGKSYFLE